MQTVILASTSPRRKELLTAMGVDFRVEASEFEERLDDSRSAAEVAMELAYGKALAVAMQNPDAIVIGADTIPHDNGKQLEKPIDRNDAKRVLTQLAGHAHFVTTGLAIIKISAGYHYTSSETATVRFRPYDERAIEDYLATGDYKDKAAAYGIQSGGAPLIDSFEGEYEAIVGLPTIQLAHELRTFGIDCSPAIIDPSL